jgi:hypothetical protein
MVLGMNEDKTCQAILLYKSQSICLADLIFSTESPRMEELGTWKARKEIGKISSNWHTTQRWGIF